MLDQTRIRLEAIHYVRQLRERWVAVPAGELQRFVSDGAEVYLKGQQGIFKPKELSDPLSITSTIDSPYADDLIEGHKILYDFLPSTREYENDGLKRCAEAELPLIYLLQVSKRPNPEYVVFAPVFVVGWDDATRQFLVDLSEQRPVDSFPSSRARVPGRQFELPAIPTPNSPSEVRELTRTYLVTTVEQRLYQARFRSEVLSAYRDRCAVCLLRIRPLLDAAHVVPNRDPKPAVIINEGLSLCATHHRAFEAGILSYDAFYDIRIDLDGIRPGDGEKSMLLAFEGRRLELPRDETLWPVPSDQIPSPRGEHD